VGLFRISDKIEVATVAIDAATTLEIKRRSPRHSYQVCMGTLVVQWRQSCQNMCCTVFVCFFKLALSWFACFLRLWGCAELVRSVTTQNNSCTDMRRMCLKNRRFDRKSETKSTSAGTKQRLTVLDDAVMLSRTKTFHVQTYTRKRSVGKNPDFSVRAKFTNLITYSFFYAFVCSSFSWSRLSSPNFTAIFTVLLICLSSSPWPS